MTRLPIPDRVSLERKSPFFKPLEFCKGLSVKIDGVEQQRVVEFCISGGWARRYVVDAAGNIVKDVIGYNARIKRVFGKIEVKWRA